MPSTTKKTPFPTTSDEFQSAQQAVFAGVGGPGGVQDNIPLDAPSREDLAVAKAKRDESTTAMDSLGSIWRQDGIANGIVAHIAGQQMLPDEKWNPFEPSKWKALSEGIQDEHLPALYETRSEAHAMYVRDLLLDKQKDQQTLADMGAWGTAGRFAANAVMPDQLLAGMVGGRMAQVVKFGRTAAGAANAASKLTPVASGIAGGAGFNAAFEKVRQNYNFENDSTQVLTAGLVGGALSVPFSLLHVKQQGRIADAHARDVAALDAIHAEAPTPHQEATLKEAVAANAVARDMENGFGDPAEGFIDKGSIGSAQVSPVGSVAEQPTAFAKARLDIFATLNKSENPEVQKLGFDLVKDAIQVDKHDAQGWTASEWKSHLVRTIKGDAMSTMKEAYTEAIKARGVSLKDRLAGNFDEEFHSLVSRVTRGDTSVLQAHPDIAPMLSKASAAQRKAYDNMLAEATAAGVKGTDTLTPEMNYVNRQWDHQKIRQMEALHGKDNVERMVADAIKVPGLTGDIAKARRFLTAIKKMEFQGNMHDVMLHGQDMGTLRTALGKHNNLSQDEIDAIVDTMFQAHPATGDAGTTARLKYRFDLDENYSLKTQAGDLRMADLMENDARYLMDSYFNTMAGHTGMAKKGITSSADWAARMQGVSGWFEGNVTKGDAAQRDIRYLNDIYAHITGKPMSTHDFSTTARAGAALRAYGRSAFLGQLGFAAAFELKQAAALMGVKAMLQHMPSFGQFLHALRTGHIPDNNFARDVEIFVGMGHETSMSYARHAEVQEMWGHRALNKFENFGNKASHVVDTLSGNAGITAMTRNWSARGFIQKASDWARKGSVNAKWRERMVGWGINDDDLDHVLSKLKQHSDVAPNGRVEGIRYEDWARDSHETYEKFQLATSRAARDAIQDHDLGETAMFMHSTMGKFLAELKTFMLVAHAKNMLKNAHYRDATAFQVYTIGLLGEALAYSTQTAANYAQDPAELAKRLTPERIAMAAWNRSSAAGVLPVVVDTGFTAYTGHSMVQQGATANTDNRSLIPPSMVLAGKALDAPKNLVGILTGNHVVTQKNARDLAALIPGARLIGASNLINEFASTFPKSAPMPSK